MRFEILPSQDQAPGLRVIPVIPDYPLCHLEGRNGIGKSLAARLLELATGGQPYAATPNAWTTLKEQLGRTRITVTGLPEEATIEIVVDPGRWPDEPDRDLGERFGDVWINGKPATWQTTRSLLRVRRISGDETLLQTLARELEERSILARAVEQQFVRPAAESWEVRLAALDDLTGDVSRDAVQGAWESRESAEAAVVSAERRAADAGAAAAAVAAAADAADKLAARRRDLPALLDQLGDAVSELATADGLVRSASVQAQQAAVALAASGGLREEIERWERLQVLRQRATQRVEIDERQLRGALSLATIPDALELAKLARLAAEATREVLAKRDSVDLVQPLRALTERIREPLAVEASRLGGEIIANTQPPQTVEALLAGVRDRHTELEGHPRPEELTQLDRAIANAERRQRLLSALDNATKVTGRKRQALAEARQKLESLFTQLSEADREAYEAAQVDLNAARDRFIAAEVRKREVRKTLAELLDIPPLTPDALVADTPDDEEDGDGDQPSAADSLYPALDRDAAIAKAVTLDADALAALDDVDPAAIATVTGSNTLADVQAIREVASADPFAQLHDAAVDALRSLHAVAVAVAAAAGRLQDEVRQARAAAADARQAMAALRATSHRAHVALSVGRGGAEWAPWATAAAPLFIAAGAAMPLDTPPNGNPTVAELAVADALEAVRSLARAQAAAALGVAGRLAGLSGYLSSQAGRITLRAGHTAGALAADYLPWAGPALQAWIEGELAALLTAPELLVELFDGSEAVQVNLTDMSVTWRPAAGGLRKRPVEAFSSGEQVFAYTRANLAQLHRDRQQGQQLVVFLDEFGAFVARDRLGQLMDFVEHEALGNAADQVIVMLPLGRAYPTEAADTQGSDEDPARAPDSLAVRARQVRDRGYFAVPVVSGRTYLA